MLVMCDRMLNGLLIAGGNLYDKINQQKGKLFSEEVRLQHCEGDNILTNRLFSIGSSPLICFFRWSYGTCTRLPQQCPTFTRLGSCTGKMFSPYCSRLAAHLSF